MHPESEGNKPPLSDDINDVIDADVKRSFTTIKFISPISLTNILKAFAYNNPDVGYCQGMNFIAGFLYFLLRDEYNAFSFFQKLVRKYEMSNLYSRNVPLLKKHFYRMDRLLYIYYPNITACFRNQNVTASLFSSTWFITLFTNALQLNDNEDPGELLLCIWDAFLLYGWKAIYKAGLFIIGKLRNKLMNIQFDRIMIVFGELSKGNFFKDKNMAVEFNKRFKEIKLRNSTLELLSREYERISRKMLVTETSE